MEIKSLDPLYIFKKSFFLTKDFYYQLLLFCIPTFLIILLWIHKPNPFLAISIFITFIYFSLALTLYIFGKFNGYSKSIYEALGESRDLFPNILLWIVLIISILAPSLGLFILPGIYLSCRFIFSFFLIAEENFPIVESLRHSWNITKRNLGLIIQNGVIIYCVYSFLILFLVTNLSNLSKTIFSISLFAFIHPLLLVYGILVFKGIVYLNLKNKRDINTLKQLDIEDARAEFNGRLEAKDFLNFQWNHLSKPLLLGLAMFVSITLAPALLRIITSSSGTTSEVLTRLISTLLVPALLLILLFLWLRSSPKRIFKSNKILNSQVSGYAYKEGLKWNSKYCKVEYSWEAFISYRELQDLVLIYTANNQAMLFPKRFFETEDDWESFKLTVANRISKKLN